MLRILQMIKIKLCCFLEILLFSCHAIRSGSKVRHRRTKGQGPGVNFTMQVNPLQWWAFRSVDLVHSFSSHELAFSPITFASNDTGRMKG